MQLFCLGIFIINCAALNCFFASAKVLLRFKFFCSVYKFLAARKGMQKCKQLCASFVFYQGQIKIK